MATPKKTKSGNYTAVTFLGKRKGKRVYKSITASSIREWHMLEAKARREFDEGQDAEERITVAETVAQYIEARENVLSPTTLHSYRWIQKLLGEFGSIQARNVTARDMQLWVNDLAAQYSPKSVRNALGLVIPALDMFFPGRKYNVTRPQKDVIQYHIPDDADVHRLLDAADGDLKKAILLAAFGSLRRGEVCGLRYMDVLRDMNAVHVHAVRIKADGYGWILKEKPKTDSSVRMIVLPKEVMALLGHGDPDAYVVSHTPAVVTNKFHALAKSLNLKCTFHGMRHYSASIMHAIGIPDQYIMERGGWKSDATLKAIYRNTLKDKNNVFTKKTNQYLVSSVLEKSG